MKYLKFYNNLKINKMRKVVTVILSAIALTFTSCEGVPNKEVNLIGDWKFEKFIKGTENLSPQTEAMVKSIVSIFKDCEISYKADGTVKMTSPEVGSKTGTYTLDNGKLDQQMGKGAKFILHLTNDKEKLVILFNEDETKDIGRILLVAAK